jgi:hypothetical protein
MTEAELAAFLASTDNVPKLNDAYELANLRQSGKRSVGLPYDRKADSSAPASQPKFTAVKQWSDR